MRTIVQNKMQSGDLTLRQLWLILDREFGGDNTALRHALQRLSLPGGVQAEVTISQWREFTSNFQLRVKQADMSDEEAYFLLLHKLPPYLRKKILVLQETQNKKRPAFAVFGLENIPQAEVFSFFQQTYPTAQNLRFSAGVYFLETHSTHWGDTFASLDNQKIFFHSNQQVCTLRVERKSVRWSTNQVVDEIKDILEIEERSGDFFVPDFPQDSRAARLSNRDRPQKMFSHPSRPRGFSDVLSSEKPDTPRSQPEIISETPFPFRNHSSGGKGTGKGAPSRSRSPSPPPTIKKDTSSGKFPADRVSTPNSSDRFCRRFRSTGQCPYWERCRYPHTSE
jgi:hypothetical protein